MLTPPAGSGTGEPVRPKRVVDAARQFEGLMIEQMLRSARSSGEGWLGESADAAGNIATEYAEQHLAMTLSAQGGLGLASMIVKGLTPNE
jgi:Rod binding domain-containing protein